MLIAGGRDKGVDLAGLADVVAERAAAAVLIGESGPTLERAVPAPLASASASSARHAGRGRPRAPTRSPASAGAPAPTRTAATVLLSPAAASFDMFVDYAARGRAFKEAVSRLADAAPGGGRMSLAPPLPRPAREHRRPAPPPAPPAKPRQPDADRLASCSASDTSPTTLILVAVVVAAAIGILMVYQLVGDEGAISATTTRFAIVGPQIAWAVARARGDGRR